MSGLQKLAVSHFCKRRIPEIQSLHADEYVDPLERNAVQMKWCDSQTTALYPRRGIAKIYLNAKRWSNQYKASKQ